MNAIYNNFNYVFPEIWFDFLLGFALTPSAFGF